MATATKSGTRAKKGPAMPTHDEVIAKVRELGGEPEVKRYEEIEQLEKTHSQGDVLHRWKVGHILGVSFEAHDEAAIRVYSVGLQRAPQTLRLSVRLAELYKEAQVRKMLRDAAAAEHELNWAHFRQLMREGLSDAQRADLVTRTVENRWGYRELKDVITATLGGKRSQGGRKPGKTRYKTYHGALSAMTRRSQAWLALEEDWIGQVKTLAAKLDDDEKHTPEFLALTADAAKQLRAVATKAMNDAEEAEYIFNAVNKAMGSPDLVPEEDEEPVLHATAPSRANGKANGKAGTATKKKRVRLARHPKMVNGKFSEN
jgi:hypothetical protein